MILEDCILGGNFVRNAGKFIYQIRKSKHFNNCAGSLLMIFCSLLRFYQTNISKVDQAIIEQITVIIRSLLNPKEFI